ncbi:MAG: DeoR/GlpR transcriptional regulator [Clostridia bacterium]|nr:DeoR/GlpR transcriptional regulator [Clostridia bacterium]
MLQLERQNDILRILNERKSATVKELCALLYASPATIRRDLAFLEERGLLRRSFGGATLCELFPDQIPVSLRAAEHLAEKKHIAAKAARLVHPGDTIFIDASSTALYMAPYLRGIQDITVITNNPHLSIALAENRIRNFCTGGETLNDSVAYTGSWAERFVRGIRAQSFFFSARGICDGMITDSSKGERDVKIAMMECAAQSYFLAHSSKLGKTFPYVVTDISRITAMIDEIE